MNEECDDCGGLLGVGGPHVCDPDEKELKDDMKARELERNAEQLEAAAFYLSLQIVPAIFVDGHGYAILCLRNEALDLRAKAEMHRSGKTENPVVKQEGEPCPADVCPYCYHHLNDPAHRPCMSSDNRK